MNQSHLKRLSFVAFQNHSKKFFRYNSSIQNERYTQIKHLKDLESHGYTRQQAEALLEIILENTKNTVTKHELNVVKNTLVDKIDDLKKQVRNEVGMIRNEVGMIRNEVGMIRNEVGMIRDEVGIIRDEVGKVRDEVNKVRDEVGKIKDFILRSVFGTAGIVLSTSGIILAYLRFFEKV
ncbi:11274_t:CDS:2 [Funneliformis mosseae]|uniref:11274_t:CDS:1 n=1 Tax=Funneliformis mosseae TaxID=27381 RepID=A0A9N8W1A5_FUNMO|nr:11274_t:CDS:2 [Funneliformis mosseae]